MDFKFKEVVEESIIYFYDHVLSSNEYTEDVFEEINHVYVQAPKADEYETKNKELLEELQYLRKVNDDLVWQRDTDEEHEAKAKAYNDTLKTLDKLIDNDERYKEARSNDFVAGMLLAYENIFYLMEDYIKESGGYDAKK